VTQHPNSRWHANLASPATPPFDAPTTGSCFVMVRASAANDAVTVARGNLAPPTL
jgi:hypothetical protein